MSTNDQNELDSLLEELKDNRKNLHGMLEDIKSFRENLDTLLPAKMDFRQKYLLQERMKTVTEIIKGELAVRNQIDSSIKLEMDMRRRTEDADIEDLPLQVKLYAKAIESLEKNNKKVEEDVSNKLKVLNKG